MNNLNQTKTYRLKEDPDVYVEARWKEQGIIEFWTAGGGPVRYLAAAQFMGMFEEKDIPDIYMADLFSMDCLQNSYLGYHRPAELWNGWAVPWMTLPTLNSILSECNLQRSDHTLKWSVDLNQTFILEDSDYPGEPQMCKRNKIHSHDVYHISGWCWEVCTNPSIGELPHLVAARILQEIDKDTILSMCQNFEELHEHCDANLLGGTGQMLEFMTTDQAVEILNEAQQIVNNTLKEKNER